MAIVNKGGDVDLGTPSVNLLSSENVSDAFPLNIRPHRSIYVLSELLSAPTAAVNTFFRKIRITSQEAILLNNLMHDHFAKSRT